MKRLLVASLTLLFATSLALATQNTNSSTTSQGNTMAKLAVKRGPVFRANTRRFELKVGNSRFYMTPDASLCAGSVPPSEKSSFSRPSDMTCLTLGSTLT